MLSVFYGFLFLCTLNLEARKPANGTWECDSPELDVISYHFHVTVWDHNNYSFAMGLAFRDALRRHFTENGMMSQEYYCPFGPNYPGPEVRQICKGSTKESSENPLGLVGAGLGPWLVPNMEYFIPKALFVDAFSWLIVNRGTLDVLIHPNTGCQDRDHTTRAVWLGIAQHIDVTGLCCRKGPVACGCWMMECCQENDPSYGKFGFAMDTIYSLDLTTWSQNIMP